MAKSGFIRSPPTSVGNWTPSSSHVAASCWIPEKQQYFKIVVVAGCWEVKGQLLHLSQPASIWPDKQGRTNRRRVKTGYLSEICKQHNFICIVFLLH